MKLFKYASMMLAMLMAFSFVSCDSDDDEKENSGSGSNVSINMSDLYGKWEPIHYIEKWNNKNMVDSKIINGRAEKSWGVDDEGHEFELSEFYMQEIREDGTLRQYLFENGEWRLHEDSYYPYYKVVGNTIQIGREGNYETYKIVKLNATTAVMELNETEEYNGTITKVWGQTTYKKVK